MFREENKLIASLELKEHEVQHSLYGLSLASSALDASAKSFRETVNSLDSSFAAIKREVVERKEMQTLRRQV